MNPIFHFSFFFFHHFSPFFRFFILLHFASLSFSFLGSSKSDFFLASIASRFLCKNSEKFSAPSRGGSTSVGPLFLLFSRLFCF